MEKQSRKLWIIHFISILAILGVFAIGSLVLANVGIRVYKNIVVSNSNNFKLRTSLSYLAAKIRQYDEKGAISIENKDGVDMLVLKEDKAGTYCTQIYFYNGAVRELLAIEGNTYKLEDGMSIIEVEKFGIKKSNENMIELTAGNKEGEMEQLQLKMRAN